MKELLPDLISKWQPIIGVQVADWGIKKMKTRWGGCNTMDHRVWLNLELAKNPSIAPNTSWFTRWCICWNVNTLTASKRL